MDFVQENVEASRTVVGGKSQKDDTSRYSTISQPGTSSMEPKPAQAAFPPPTGGMAETKLDDTDGENLYDYIDDNKGGLSVLELSANMAYGSTAKLSAHINDHGDVNNCYELDKGGEVNLYELDSEALPPPPHSTQTTAPPSLPTRSNKKPAGEVDQGEEINHYELDAEVLPPPPCSTQTTAPPSLPTRSNKKLAGEVDDATALLMGNPFRFSHDKPEYPEEDEYMAMDGSAL